MGFGFWDVGVGRGKVCCCKLDSERGLRVGGARIFNEEPHEHNFCVLGLVDLDHVHETGWVEHVRADLAVLGHLRYWHLRLSATWTTGRQSSCQEHEHGV